MTHCARVCGLYVLLSFTCSCVYCEVRRFTSHQTHRRPRLHLPELFSIYMQTKCHWKSPGFSQRSFNSKHPYTEDFPSSHYNKFFLCVMLVFGSHYASPRPFPSVAWQQYLNQVAAKQTSATPPQLYQHFRACFYSSFGHFCSIKPQSRLAQLLTRKKGPDKAPSSGELDNTTFIVQIAAVR